MQWHPQYLLTRCKISQKKFELRFYHNRNTFQEFFFHRNEHLHNKHKKQSPGTMTILGARDTKKVITKCKNQNVKNCKIVAVIKGKTPLNSEKTNLFVDKTKSIVLFKFSKFTLSLKDSLLYSRIRVTTDLLLFNIVLSISLIFFKRVDRSA